MHQINGKISAGLPVVGGHVGWGVEGGVQGCVGSKCHWDGEGCRRGGRGGKAAFKKLFGRKKHIDARKSSIKAKAKPNEMSHTQHLVAPGWDGGQHMTFEPGCD